MNYIFNFKKLEKVFPGYIDLRSINQARTSKINKSERSRKNKEYGSTLPYSKSLGIS